MCKGDLDKSEITKLTGSANQSGHIIIHNNMAQKRAILTLSLKEKKCPNFNLRALDNLTPPGTELPVV